MRKISAKKYAISLYEATLGVKEPGLPVMMDNFVKLLIKNNAFSQAPKIMVAFDEYAKEKEGILDVEARSAKPLAQTEKEKVIHHLQTALNKKIHLKEIVDHKLIGGIVLHYQDTVIDGSIKKRLEVLKENLIS
jgi:F-type H+-transporting ATPase subunit delta